MRRGAVARETGETSATVVVGSLTPGPGFHFDVKVTATPQLLLPGKNNPTEYAGEHVHIYTRTHTHARAGMRVLNWVTGKGHPSHRTTNSEGPLWDECCSLAAADLNVSHANLKITREMRLLVHREKARLMGFVITSAFCSSPSGNKCLLHCISLLTKPPPKIPTLAMGKSWMSTKANESASNNKCN